MLSQISHDLCTLLRQTVTWLLMLLFAAINLLELFWVEQFFARNLTDLRPFFDFLPAPLAGLAVLLTMRQWSDERRKDRLQLTLTTPVRDGSLLMTKFLASTIVLLLALFLTLPLPIFIAMLGDLDRGLVVSGYLAALLLVFSVTSIGLYASSSSEHQVGALVISFAILFLLALPGMPVLTRYFDYQTAAWLTSMGLLSRYEIVSRGVFDLGTLLYFIGLTLVFLRLNLLELRRIRFVPDKWWKQRGAQLASAVAGLFILVGVAWISAQGMMRLDLSEDRRFTLSETTQKLLQGLEAPVTIHAFISQQSHPLLSRLVPQLRDLLGQYDYAGGPQVRVIFSDPKLDSEAEQLAVERFALRPTTFQSADRYQTSVISSYFDIVIEAGAHYETLNYRDLIEMKMLDETDLDVQLRHPEYDLSRALQRLMATVADDENVVSRLPDNLRFTGYISTPEYLPEALRDTRQILEQQIDEFSRQSQGRLTAEFIDPAANDGAVAEQILADHDFRPQVLDPLDEKTFFFYMLFSSDEKQVAVSLPRDLDPESLHRNLLVGLKRFVPGGLRHIGLVVPRQQSPLPGLKVSDIPEYSSLRKRLGANADVSMIELDSGMISPEIELLAVMNPDQVSEKGLFVIDQFLMRGGSLLIVTSPWKFKLGASISASRHQSGLEEWLGFHGVHIQPALVMDQQNMAFPVPVQRKVGEVTFDQVQMLPYPYFADIRAQGLASASQIVGQLDQLTVNWPSPISLQIAKNLSAHVLLKSSAESALDVEAAIQPDFLRWPESGFMPIENSGPYSLAVALQGDFYSWFSGRAAVPAGVNKYGELLNQSQSPSRLIVVAAGPFLSDEAILLATEVNGSSYHNSLLFVDQLVNWATEQEGLGALRGEGRFARVLRPLKDAERLRWEWFNYLSPMVLLGLYFFLFRIYEAYRHAYQSRLLTEQSTKRVED